MWGAFEAIGAAGRDLAAKDIANFVTGAHARAMKATGPNAHGLADAARPAEVAALLAAIARGQVSRQVGRDLLAEHLASGTDAATLRAGAGPGPINDDATLSAMVEAAITDNPGAVADYRAGKPVTGFFVGQVMKRSAGAADAARVTQLVRERLDEGG